MYPAAEVEVGDDVVRALLAEQHPDLAGLPLAPLAPGWDNLIWRLGDTLAVRLPRRLVAVPLARHEQRWLPVLAPRLPLPVPVPVRIGRPGRGYPWPWSVVAWVDGEPGDRAPLADPGDAAARLGVFLRALHRPTPPDAPRNPYRSVPLADRADAFTARLGELGGEVDAAALQAVWDESCAAPPWPGPAVWVHGDLHPGNLVVARGTLAGVVDFGDVAAGDPAVDLAGGRMALPAPALPAFAAAYGDHDPDLWRRARGWAVLFGLMLLAVGLEGRPTYEAVGRRTLDPSNWRQ